jgi:hypothetical protein
MPLISLLTNPSLLYSRSMVLSKPCPIPQQRGLYAWFFKDIPPSVPVEGCITNGDNTLLYLGISPKDENSTQNLRKRIITHYRHNAEGSTLRLTLGTLLTKQSGLPLRRVGSGKRMTFTHLGEQWLDIWMNENAFVCWVEHPTPWEIEKEIIKSICLPLNIQDNSHHPFSDKLSTLRKNAKQLARQQSIANEDDQQRRM